MKLDTWYTISVDLFASGGWLYINRVPYAEGKWKTTDIPNEGYVGFAAWGEQAIEIRNAVVKKF
jgi:hypothetical protein